MKMGRSPCLLYYSNDPDQQSPGDKTAKAQDETWQPWHGDARWRGNSPVVATTSSTARESDYISVNHRVPPRAITAGQAAPLPTDATETAAASSSAEGSAAAGQ